jgi:Putative adhesin
MAAVTSPEIPGPATTTARLPLTRGRRAALAIGVPVCLLLVAYTALDLVALFGQGRFPVSYSAGAVKSLTVTSSGGQLLINGSTGQATVTGTGDYSLVRPAVTERSTAGRASVRYHCGFPVGNCGLNATIGAPVTVPVSVSTGGGNVDIVSTAGPVTLSTGGGDIDASDPSGPLSLNTDGGNVLLAHVESPTVTATSGGGDVEVYFSRVPRDVRVQTSGGNITLVLPRGTTQYNVSAHTDGGTVSNTIPQNSSSQNVITATTGGGNITISEQ